MTLLGTSDFKELLESGQHLVATRLDVGETLKERQERERAQWAARGVDLEALEGYAVWEAEDTLNLLLRQAGVPADEPQAALVISAASLRAMLAATAEMAFSVGFHMHDRLLTKVPAA